MKNGMNGSMKKNKQNTILGQLGSGMRKALVLTLSGALLVTAAACSSGAAAATTAADATKKVETKQSVEAFGTIKSNEYKNISIDFTASVAKLNVVEGQRVKNGDVLAALDIKQFEAQLAAKENELAAARIDLQKAIAGASGDQNDVGRLSNELGKKQDLLRNGNDPDLVSAASAMASAAKLNENAQAELNRQRQLFEQGAISQAEYDAAVKVAEVQKNTYISAKGAYDSLKLTKQKELDTLMTTIDAKMADLGTLNGANASNNVQLQQQKVNNIERDLAVMKDKISKAYFSSGNVVADVKDGVVYNIAYAQGDLLSNDKPLLTLMDTSKLVVEAEVAEEFIKDVKVGSKVTITPLADNSKKYNGTVNRINGRATQKSGETIVIVEIQVDNNDGFLLPGFNVDVDISK